MSRITEQSALRSGLRLHPDDLSLRIPHAEYHGNDGQQSCWKRRVNLRGIVQEQVPGSQEQVKDVTQLCV